VTTPSEAKEEWIADGGDGVLCGDEAKLPVSRQCKLLDVSRTAQYRKRKEPDRTRENEIKDRIDYWSTVFPPAGARRLKKLMKREDGIVASRKLIRRYMEEMGVYATYPKPRLSSPGKHNKAFPYLLRGKPVFLPNQVWAIDITYIKMSHGHMYLTAIIDWYSRYIVGWELSDTLDTASVLNAVRCAINEHGVPGIINSDQGSQFTSKEYIECLLCKGIRQSMDGKARWVDNVIIERWFRSLKWEDVYINEYGSPRELRAGIAAYIDLYNNIRPHEAHGEDTPAVAYFGRFAAVGVGQERAAA
jgi:putative transposase